MRDEYDNRKNLIAYYSNFNQYERLEIKIEIEKLRELIKAEHEMRDTSVGVLEKEKNERMEKMRKEMLLEVKQVKTDMLNFTEDKLQGTTRLTIK